MALTVEENDGENESGRTLSVTCRRRAIKAARGYSDLDKATPLLLGVNLSSQRAIGLGGLRQEALSAIFLYNAGRRVVAALRDVVWETGKRRKR